MRIAEIAVIGAGRKERDAFIQAVCQRLELANDNVTFGRLPINDQLVLHLYGIATQPNGQALAWDLIARKMLGYIVLFSWQDAEAFERLKPIVDYLSSRYDAPMVVTAHLAGIPLPVPPALCEEGIALTTEGKLTFCDIRNPASARKILALLIDSLLTKMP
jgi:signal recognition particle receptor subunit beta